MMMSENDQRMELGRVIGKNIRRLRDEAGLSQRAFAEIVQNAGLNAWSTARLSNAETSRQPLNAVFELVGFQKVFMKLLERDVSLDEFFIQEFFED